MNAHDRVAEFPALALREAIEPAARGCAGREAELARLLGLAREVVAPRMVLVEGASGIGKTRLVNELRTRVRLEGGISLEGHCQAQRPYAPFADIIERALQVLAEVGRSPRTDLTGLRCSGGCHRFWHQHRTMEPGTSQPLLVPIETAAFEARVRLFDAIAGLLREVADVRPPVVILHNLEFVDEGTLDLIEHVLDAPLGSGGAPLLVVGSLRSDATGPSSVRTRALAQDRVQLGPLGEDGVRALLGSDEIVRRVLDRTGGHPDLLDVLFETAPLSRRDRMERQLGALDPASRKLASALAVLARPASLETLQRVADVTSGALPERLVVTSYVDGERCFAFERESVRQDVYGLLGDLERKRLHARSIEACAALLQLDDAVRHAIASEDAAVAQQFALSAAALLAGRHAHSEAAALLEALLNRWPSDDLRAEAASLHRISGNYSAALLHARVLVANAPRSAEALQRLGDLLVLAGSFDEAAQTLDEARVIAVAAKQTARTAEIDTALAEAAYRRGRYADATRHAAEAVAHSSADTIVIQARNILGKVALAQKAPEHAVEHFERNRREAGHAGLAHHEAQALTNLAIAHFLRQDYPTAEACCQRAIDLATLASDTRDRAIATENLAVLAHLRRDYATALKHYHAAAALLRRLGNRPMLVRLACNLGEIHLSLGDVARARTYADQAARLEGPGTPRPVTAERWVLVGRIAANDGRTGEARFAFERALAILQGLGDTRVTALHTELAKLAVLDGDLDRARALLTGLTPHDAKRAADVSYAQALLAQAEGDGADAAEHAVRMARGAEDPDRLASALSLVARVSFDEGDSERAHAAIAEASTIDDSVASKVPAELRDLWLARPIRAQLASLATRIAAPASPPLLEGRGTDAAGRRFPSIAGRSAALQAVFGVIEKVAPHDTIVLIRGESGTGKELVAEAIHQRSTRANRACIKVNCGALVETLLLSELFGHERGAFTGATTRKKGRFELADGGTIFLDEIGDISAKTQVALLRVLQEREFERVGGTTPIRVDVRIVAATHRDLEKMVREGLFREDLYYRLRGVVVDMPPLRRRLEDLPILCERLLEKIARERNETPKHVGADALEVLASHSWPGNVRELENVLRSASLFCEASTLSAADLAELQPIAPPRESLAVAKGPIEGEVYEHIRRGDSSLFEMKKTIERECITRALAETGGNITKAASLLGMKRPRLSQLVKEYDLGHLGK